MQSIINLFLKYYHKYKIFWKYCLGGGTALIIDVGLLYVFTEFAGLWYILSATLSFIIAGAYNYVFQKLVTFKDQNKNYLKQLLLFLVIAIIGLGINNGLLYTQVEWLNLWYILAKIIAAAVVLSWNFLANKYVTFKNVSSSSTSQIEPELTK